MTREELLKGLIQERYGSILKFSKKTNIPYTTIRNIFTRGIDGVGAGTVVEICKYLNVDVESLMNGALSVRPNIRKEQVWHDYVHSSAPDPTFDDFTYAMHNEGKELSEKSKQTLLEMAKFLRQQEQNEKGE